MSNIIDSIQLSGVTYTLSAQTGGGGKVIEAGRGISVTTGETADTVSFNLPISAGTGLGCIVEGSDTVANGEFSHAEGEGTTATSFDTHAEGYYTLAKGNFSHAEGNRTTASGGSSHAEGYSTQANGVSSHAEGEGTITNNQSEHASGKYNVSNTGSTDADKTLFSVGNGTSYNARHNAFEIRQSGDIYLSSGGTDIKLQDHLGSGGNPTVELTQAEYDALVTAGTVSPTTYYIITDAQAGDLTQYWTSAQTNSAINAAVSGKQDTLVSGTNIKTINNESLLGSGNIDIQGGGSITIDPSLDSGSTNAVANSAITEAVNSKVNISDNNVSAFSGVQLAIAEKTYYGDKDVRTIYIKSIGNTQYTDKSLCIVRFGNSNSSMSFTLTGSTSGSYSSGGTITAYTINSSYVTHSLSNGVITVTFNDTSYHLLSVENVVKNIGIYYTKGGYSSGQTADVVENTVYDVLTELGENLVNNNNNNNNFVTLDTPQDITATKTFVNTDKGIIFKQKQNANKIGFLLRSSASTNNEIATFEFRPNTYTDSSSVSHPLLYLGHYRGASTANAGVVQTMVGFRQYDQKGAAAYHYLMPLPAEAKTPFSLTTSFKNYFAPLGFKNGSTMITTDNTGVADFSSVLGGLKLVKITQSAYDALTTKDDNTVYFIGDSTNGYTMKIGSANVN